MEEDLSSTTHVDGGRRRARRFPAGRVCADDACATQLSVYNGGAHCALHDPHDKPRTRGRRID